MKKCLAFVLGGGGARGALEVGALRALLEAGLIPDLLVGTSIGAVNAAGLAFWGVDLDGIRRLEAAYQKVAESRFMDPRLARFAMRALSMRPSRRASQQLTEFFISEGITPDLRFGQISNVRLAMVASDLESGHLVIFGKDPEQLVLEGIMASTAVPPWFAPVEKDGCFIVDGGMLSNLPVEPALTLGATEIIALDVDDPEGLLGVSNSNSRILEKLIYSVTQRQVCLETELALSRGVPVHHISLRSLPPIAIWDFNKCGELFKIGYETMRHQIWEWSAVQPA